MEALERKNLVTAVTLSAAVHLLVLGGFLFLAREERSAQEFFPLQLQVLAPSAVSVSESSGDLPPKREKRAQKVELPVREESSEASDFDEKKGSGSSAESSSATSPRPAAFSDLTARGALVLPEYPEEARDWGWEGFVTVRFLVTVDGRVESLQVVASDGYEGFLEAVLGAAALWEFDPPGAVLTVEKRFDFKLKSW